MTPESKSAIELTRKGLGAGVALGWTLADLALEFLYQTARGHPLQELQRRSSKILEEQSVKSLLLVGNLHQSSTTLGLELVSIVNYTRSGSSIKRPTPNYLATQQHVNWSVFTPKVAKKPRNKYQRPSFPIFEKSSLQLCSLQVRQQTKRMKRTKADMMGTIM